MTYRYWPLFDLRLATPGPALCPMTEADLAAIADLLPDDVEQDPAATTYDVGDARTGNHVRISGFEACRPRLGLSA